MTASIRSFCAWPLAIALLLLASLGLAQSPASAAGAITLELRPALGTEGRLDSWKLYNVHIRNGSQGLVRGSLELTINANRGANLRRLTRAPFSVEPGLGAVVHLPAPGLTTYGSSVAVVARDESGRVLAQKSLEPPLAGTLLVDLHDSGRLAAQLGRATLPSSRPNVPADQRFVRVGVPSRNPANGSLELPTLAGGYAPATLVVTPSRVLRDLRNEQSVALADWVLAGGALAVVVDSEADLTTPPLAPLVGGAAQAVPRRALGAARDFRVAPDDSAATPGDPTNPDATSSVRRGAPPAIRAKLQSYEGGNLRPSVWGSVASYGLGEVHLLAFGVDRAPFLGDTWVRLQLLDLLDHVSQRTHQLAFPHGHDAQHGVTQRISQQLDPNEAQRWTLPVATVLLLIYAILAGPVAFRRASRRGRPLRALFWLPLWSLLTAALLVTLGIIGKGIAGRARHLSLIEAGAGMARGAVTRFRGLYVSDPQNLRIEGSSRAALPTLPNLTDWRLLVTPDRLQLDDITAAPWSPVVVREQGFADLGRGISLVANGQGELLVTNRSGRELVAVVVHDPAGRTFFFEHIADGKQVRVASGQGISLGNTSTGARTPGFASSHPLAAYDFSSLADAQSAHLGESWSALDAATAGEVDWWPSDAPVLIGQLRGGEGTLVDSGLRIEKDRLLVRVIGWGGKP